LADLGIVLNRDEHDTNVGSHNQAQSQTMPASTAATATLSPKALPISRSTEREWQQITVEARRGGRSLIRADILYDDSAEFMLDINVGRLVARGANEALEQHIGAGWIDPGAR
jgi:hypothetical protein